MGWRAADLVSMEIIMVSMEISVKFNSPASGSAGSLGPSG
jgi:hypothetical protein